MKKLSRRVLSFSLILFFFLLPFLLFNLFYNRTFLPPSLLPTVEALLKSPTTPPEWIKLIPPAGSTLHWGESIVMELHVCTIGMDSCKSPLRHEDDSFQGLYKYRDWSVIFINGGQYKGFLGGSAVGTIRGGTVSIPLYALLLPGYHLFKIEPANSQEEQNNRDPKLSYEWAYRVE